MPIDRRTFLETPMWAAGLALSPSFNHLLGATNQNENPPRAFFITYLFTTRTRKGQEERSI
jgi:hypothetical protein